MVCRNKSRWNTVHVPNARQFNDFQHISVRCTEFVYAKRIFLVNDNNGAVQTIAHVKDAQQWTEMAKESQNNSYYHSPIQFRTGTIRPILMTIASHIKHFIRSRIEQMNTCSNSFFSAWCLFSLSFFFALNPLLFHQLCVCVCESVNTKPMSATRRIEYKHIQYSNNAYDFAGGTKRSIEH